MRKIINFFKLDISGNRIFGLDVLRAAAIFFVVFNHSFILLPKEFGNFFEKHFVYDGVTLFFVLSGFLIGGILIKTFEKNGISFRVITDFWKRRWFRTLPAYYLTALIILLLNILFKPQFIIQSSFKYFVFLQNLTRNITFDFFPESWSLSIEEIFYLITPMILYMMIKIFHIKLKWSVFFTILSIVVCVLLFRLYRFYFSELPHNWRISFSMRVSTRLDSLMYGVLGAFINYYYPKIFKKNKFHLLMFVAGILILIADKYFIPGFFKSIAEKNIYSNVFRFSAVPFAVMLLLPYLYQMKHPKNMNFITKISLISYSMYLLNLTLILDWFIRKFWAKTIHIENYNLKIISNYTLYWVLLFAFSTVMYKYIELPFLKYRDRITKK
ncbi:MAG: acyltransferase [Flavobacteriaceae bacterium]|jgi:peptidoglycan/LPS O-acetylase OafA/YrhL|nr:acyltransferase [Flavobacteriaceae bacterium]